MTTWARLTWQAPDPTGLARDLARRLGVAGTADGGVAGGVVLGLGPAELEVVPWHREAPSDEPRDGGRLVFEPITAGSTGPRPPCGPAALVLEAVGWATVELDRAEAELADWLEGAPGDPDDDLAEPHLGARARVRDTAGLPAARLVLLEPTTEGRVAASLVRDGEGPCALYLRPADGLDAWVRDARSRGATVGVRAGGPLGASVLVAGGAVAGPHLVVVAGPAQTSTDTTAGTIGA